MECFGPASLAWWAPRFPRSVPRGRPWLRRCVEHRPLNRHRIRMNEPERSIAHRKPQLVYWIFQLTGWGVITLGRFVGGVTLLDLSWPRLLLELLLINTAGLMISHRLRDFVRRNRWRALPIRALAWRILVVSLVCGAPLGIVTQFSYLSALVDPELLLREYAPALQFQLALPFGIALEIANWTAVFVVWLVIYFTAIAVREHRSAELKQSEMARALQAG